MSKPTPTPWIVRTQVRVGPNKGGYYLARNDTESATAWAKDEANAAFICKAVNAHDLLVKALQFIADGYDNQDINHVDFRNHYFTSATAWFIRTNAPAGSQSRNGASMTVQELKKVNIIPQDDAPTSMIPHVPPTQSLIHVLARAMSDPSIDVEKVERYAALYERAIAREDEIAFNDAMRLAQSEMRHIAADANNPQTKSKYATYAALDSKVRPIYSKHGFSLSFYTGDGAPEGCIRVQCKVARGGHTERPFIDMPADGKGAKGGDVMTKTHATGAGVTYGRRYLLGMIFNLVIGEDNDGNDAADTGFFISQAQVATLVALADEVNADKAKFCAYFKVPSLADIKDKDFQRAVDALNSKRAK